MGGEYGKEFEAIATHDNLEKKPKPNLDQVINNIQIEPIESFEIVVPIAKPKEPVAIVAKTPQLFISQPIPIFGHLIIFFEVD